MGTIVSLSDPKTVFGIVVDEEFWKRETAKENPEMVKDYEEMGKINGLNPVPIMLFGKVINSKMDSSPNFETEPKEKFYVQRFIYSNAEAHISIIPDRGILRLILDYSLEFTGGHNRIAEYLEDAKEDLVILEAYMEWLQTGAEIPGDLCCQLILFFKEALPKERLGI